VSRFGDEIEAVHALNDAIGLGALTVIDEQDLSIDSMVGYDAIPRFLNQVQERDGVTGTVAPNPVWQGGWAAVQLHDAIEGEEFQVPQRMVFTNDTLCVEDTSTYGDLDVPFEVVGAGSFQEMIYEGETTPYDWELMSRAESGDDWESQNGIQPITPEQFKQELLWDEQSRPEGYELPDSYNDTDLFEEVTQWYDDHLGTNPLVE